MPARIIGIAALACIGVGFFLTTLILGRTPPVARPTYGARGLKRQRALDKGGLFALAEPAVRLVGGWFVALPLGELRGRVQTRLGHSGEYLGLSPNEFFGLTLLSTVAFAALGLGLVYGADMPLIVVVFAVVLGATLPTLQINGEMQERFTAINRSLPTAIDLVALCMGAGLDFPGALKQVVDKTSRKDAVLIEELGRILSELEVGHTRRKALEGFAERCPTEAVRDFVSTVVQAEAKGTPLAEVLTIQARMLRMRRSVMAEESAAKAGVMMMGPLMLMFICVIFLLLGPFVVQWLTTGLG
ncbi:MAG: type II secretion system F family protein [Myxococcota bacterium]